MSEVLSYTTPVQTFTGIRNFTISNVNVDIPARIDAFKRVGGVDGNQLILEVASCDVDAKELKFTTKPGSLVVGEEFVVKVYSR